MQMSLRTSPIVATETVSELGSRDGCATAAV